ncbi:Su(var)3-3 [Bugula neritina]|uniref:Su(Var)3-3 n=1 Tax=Bugula neritina TaxID=10212 RepID=A0A7J7KAA8_BUGNE|nr:Su(var)3-3 [Bugula neritina]
MLIHIGLGVILMKSQMASPGKPDSRTSSPHVGGNYEGAKNSASRKRKAKNGDDPDNVTLAAPKKQERIDPTGLAGAAFQSRLPTDKLIALESQCFSDVVANEAATKIYLYIRNRLLQLWVENPRQEVTVEK